VALIVDKDLYNKIFDLTSKKNASYTDIRDEDSLYTSIKVVDGKVESSVTGSETGIGIRLLIDGAWGFAYGAKKDYKQLVKMAVDCQKASKRLSNKVIELASVKPVQDEVIIKQDKRSQDIPFEEKMELALDADKHLQDKEEVIKSTTVRYQDILRRQTIATSEGTLLYEARPYTFLAMSATAKEGVQTNQSSSRAGHVGGFEIFSMVDIPTRAEETKERAIKGLKAPAIKSGKYPVVLDGSLNFLFAHEAAGHSSEGDFLQTAGVFRGKLGKKIAPDKVNLIDDGSLEYVPDYKMRTFGFMKYDDEGVPVERTEIIKRGVLNTYLTDRASAAYFGLEPTGNCRAEFFSSFPIVRMENTYLEATKGNDLTQEEVLELVKNGLLLRYGGGGQVNTIRGTFNFGTKEVYEITKGEIGDLRQATTLSGNTLETLSKIMGISNKMADPSANVGFCGKGSQRAPTGTGAGWCAIETMMIGG
jgi:TldD protein